MNENDIFESQLIQQIGHACLVIAKQAASVAALQYQIAELQKNLAAEKAKNAAPSPAPAPLAL